MQWLLSQQKQYKHTYASWCDLPGVLVTGVQQMTSCLIMLHKSMKSSLQVNRVPQTQQNYRFRLHAKLHTHTTVLLLVWNMSGSTRVSRYQKGKTKKVKANLDLPEQEIVSGSGICWAICKSAPHADNHANIPPLSFLQAGCPS